jgi:formate/nitrite transporter FocA (FNT family)
MMALGADISVTRHFFSWRSWPATLGNVFEGGLLLGAVYW